MALLPEVDDLELQPNETIASEWFADHTQAGVPLRGKLILTNQRLAFQPTTMGWALQAITLLGGVPTSSGKPWSSALRDVATVKDEPPSERMGEKGKVLQVELQGGDPQQFFVVTDFEGSAQIVRNALK